MIDAVWPEMATPIKTELVLMGDEGSLVEERMWAHVIDAHLDPTLRASCLADTDLCGNHT